ncbi:hypothetical protein BU25DRAFT_423441 [Macroventuria anomochaeta]|uniref:Uncharacterized protein n=1 Tax=Macroventuria anomochaeta TaxID=301207 RepID=A0ACB6RTW2_9PLEO|nr:uncharacterized protein BU25DRAFT_423441 [Macroventuria anomochaeta]KAF2625376.1 hypothetical protein BU25DRAFT_423441 [Macroventuria anomochaeta]
MQFTHRSLGRKHCLKAALKAMRVIVDKEPEPEAEPSAGTSQPKVASRRKQPPRASQRKRKGQQGAEQEAGVQSLVKCEYNVEEDAQGECYYTQKWMITPHLSLTIVLSIVIHHSSRLALQQLQPFPSFNSTALSPTYLIPKSASMAVLPHGPALVVDILVNGVLLQEYRATSKARKIYSTQSPSTSKPNQMPSSPSDSRPTTLFHHRISPYTFTLMARK